MRTLAENVQRVVDAHTALSASIAAKGVEVPEGTKLTDMSALVDAIETKPKPNWYRGVSFQSKNLDGDIVVGNELVVDFTTIFNYERMFSYNSRMTSVTLPEGFGTGPWCYATEMFKGCAGLKSIAFNEGFGQNIDSASYMFAQCYALQSLSFPDGFCASNQFRYSGSMFSQCTSLESIHFPAGFGQNSTGSTVNMFYQCRALKNITGELKMKVSFSLADSTLLTHDSLMNVINSIQEVNTPQTLNLGSANLMKLSEDEIAIATTKGWIVA